jgi:hypothetical protein
MLGLSELPTAFGSGEDAQPTSDNTNDSVETNMIERVSMLECLMISAYRFRAKLQHESYFAALADFSFADPLCFSAANAARRRIFSLR